MAYYRLYSLTHEDRIIRARELECPSDEAAIARARQTLDDLALELWQGARKVARLEPVPPRRSKVA